MDGMVVFLLGALLCFGVWFGIAWLSRYLEDGERRNKAR